MWVKTLELGTLRTLAIGTSAAVFTLGCGVGASTVEKALGIPTSETVGGSVSGLNGTGLVLQDNGGDNLTVTANGSFTFATAVSVGANYTVTVKTQPANPAQTCSVTSGTGTVGGTAITTVMVSCTNNAGGAATAPGTPVGRLMEQVIDAEGGSISSEDGRFSVSIPRGALAAATTVSVQRITNQAPGGVGDAYRLEPAGLQFARPVTVTFHYSTADLAGTAAHLFSAAYQDATGRWGVYKSVALEVRPATVSIESGRLGDWALVTGASLTPAIARVSAGHQLTLTLTHCQTVDSGDAQVAWAAVCAPLSAAAVWRVDGESAGSERSGLLSYDGAIAWYSAPASVPADAVEVSAEAPVGPRGGATTLIASLTIGR